MDAIPLYIESLKIRSGPGARKAAGIGQPAGAGSDPFNLRGAAGPGDQNDPFGIRPLMQPGG